MHKVWREQPGKAEHLNAVEQEAADFSPGFAEAVKVGMVPSDDRVAPVEVVPAQKRCSNIRRIRQTIEKLQKAMFTEKLHQF